MDDEPWQLRLRALGLSQKAWARLSGQTQNTVSRQLREEWKLPRLVRLAILAWERLTPDQRADVEAELSQDDRAPIEAELKRRERTQPKKPD